MRSGGKRKKRGGLDLEWWGRSFGESCKEVGQPTGQMGS